MKAPPLRPPLCCCLLFLAGLASAEVPATEIDIPPPALPTWQVLEYEQKAFFVTAKSRVEITPDAKDSQRWQLTANSSVASNSEEVTLDVAAIDGRAQYRKRLSKGRDKRYKTYDFMPTHILRCRYDPPPESRLPPGEWPVSSRKKIEYPPAAANMVVTDAYALLALAGRFQASGDESAEVVVNTEFNFYRVRMTHGNDSPATKVNIRTAGGESAITGKRKTRAVNLLIEPMGELPDKHDFSLLGLNGDIIILFDEETGVPLQLRGNAPRIGSTEIDLKRVTLRESAQ
jgi:hypothetical protein